MESTSYDGSRRNNHVRPLADPRGSMGPVGDLVRRVTHRAHHRLVRGGPVLGANHRSRRECRLDRKALRRPLRL